MTGPAGGGRVPTPAVPTPAVPVTGPAGRRVLLAALLLVLIGWTVVAWPRLTLPFSSLAPIVHTLDADVVADAGAGLTGDQLAGVRSAIGTRPIAFVFLAPEPADAPDESAVCRAVSPRLPDVELIIVRGDDGRYACTGDRVPVTDDGPDDLHGLAYEIRINAALRYVSDPVAKAQAAALVHDSMVNGGRLAPAERSLRTPWLQVAGTLAVVAAALAGVLLLLIGLRRLALYLRARRARRRDQDRLRDELDDALAELALAVVAVTPEDPVAAPARPADGTDRAAGYVDLLTRARTATGGWAGLLAQARRLLGPERSDPMRPDPARSDPTRPDPTRPDPMRPDPMRKAPR